MRVAAVVIVTLLAGRAGAHVAASVDDNNRYLKLTPEGDRVRIAYTVFFGDIPGAGERRTIDTNHDGQIDDAEGHAFGTRLATEVAAALEVEVDGKIQPVRWDIVDVGMGSPAVAAGSFSIDMVSYACLASLRGRHRLVVRDRFRIPRPGETEVKVEDSPGIQIEHARVGAADDPTYDYRFAGPGGPLSDDGLDLQFTAGPRSVVTPDATCTAPTPSSSSHGRLVLVVIAGVIAIGVVLGFLIVLRRRNRAPHRS